ncbi:MAG: hypothetical protein GY913_19490 [Proteobacteria bacterium]|nr:hypothetical protein [Pseudomonadota bacterium]MCP4919095.1 hypothetical protein [Pseudomonadota bacterium]
MARNPFHPKSLKLVVEAFAKRQTGILSCGSVPGGGVLFEGEPLTPEAGDWLVECLAAPDLEFMPSELRFARSEDAKAFGTTLWNALFVLADARSLDNREVVVLDTDLARYATRFPVHPDTRRMLQVPRDGRSPLEWMFDTEEVDRDIVRADYSVLIALGFFSTKTLQQVLDEDDGVRENQFVAVQRKTMSDIFDELVELRRTKANRGISLETIQREWALVRQANEWVTCGVRNTDSADRVEAAALATMDRYETLQYDFSLSSEAREIIRMIHMKNVSGANLVRRAVKNRGFYNTAKDAYKEGMRQLGARNYSVAVKMLSQARKANPMDPLILANLGWALYHDETRPGPERKEMARSILNDAEAISDNQSDPALMLARIDQAEGFTKQAVARLMGVLRKDKGNSEARELLHKIKG